MKEITWPGMVFCALWSIPFTSKRLIRSIELEFCRFTPHPVEWLKPLRSRCNDFLLDHITFSIAVAVRTSADVYTEYVCKWGVVVYSKRLYPLFCIKSSTHFLRHEVAEELSRETMKQSGRYWLRWTYKSFISLPDLIAATESARIV